MYELTGQNIIAIEGLGGVGKTTAAQGLARQYGLANLNTGTLFRGLSAAAALEFKTIYEDELFDFALGVQLDIDVSDPQKPEVAVNGKQVTDFLQRPEVTRIASVIGSNSLVAARIEAQFSMLLQGGNMVVEGKRILDRIGHYATTSIFLHADFDVRVERKFQQAQAQNITFYSYREARRDVMENDMRDRKLMSKVAANAEFIDTTRMSRLEVVKAIAITAGLA